MFYKYFRDVHYIERNGSKEYYIVEQVPPVLEKKMKLLKHFRRYMNDHLVKAGADTLTKDADQLSRTPYMCQWFRFNNSIIMQLTNGTLQVCINYEYIILEDTLYIKLIYRLLFFYFVLDKLYRSQKSNIMSINECSNFH